MDIFNHVIELQYALFLGPLTFIVFKTVYNTFFHPLSKFPGPWQNKISIGKQSYELLRLHSKYGHVVRYGPNELSFSSARAWKDIYGTRPGQPVFTKGTWYEGLSIYAHLNVSSFLTERDPAKHAAMSRHYGTAFSRGFLNEIEPLVLDYIDRFISHVRAKTANGGVIDLTTGYSSMTFDVIGDMAFGQDFGAIGLEQPHRFIRELNESLIFTGFLEAVKRFPVLKYIAKVFFSGKVAELKQTARNGGDFALSVIQKRIAQQESLGRKDFLTKVLDQRANGKADITELQLAAQSWDFIGAATETTSATLVSTTYFLLQDKELLAQLTAEIRNAFPNAAAITNVATEKLELLHRVCLEGLRLPTGAPPILPRLTPANGAVVDGNAIPGGTPVTMSPMVAALDPANFKEPLTFKPERWLGNNGDILDASQPFSIGPRGCAGKHIAWMEIRVTLAKMLYTFDLELDDPQLDWIGKDFDNLPQYALWMRPKLNVKARVVCE